MADSARRIVCLFMILAASGLAAAQEIQHETRAIAVEVPVRVFKGNTFVDHLSISDFEVYEDGRPQTLDAVYLVKKAFIERQEGTQPVLPDTGRHFYL
ncbi:MAG: VWA domain-containing protein, partial [Candidatus Aminicenantales bacterium]